ncbi:MAG: OsmC family protein [candidate division NC10 bacterium]|nr:OsmC family protein [candidate division NC10 bacterium]
MDLELMDGYQFKVSFGIEGMPDLILDEMEPLGRGKGPNPARLLSASTAGCLAASLLFCLRKARAEVKGMKVRVESALARNERGRLRIGEMKVRISPEVDDSSKEKLARCRQLFEEFCIVTQSIRQGIPVEVEVE